MSSAAPSTVIRDYRNAKRLTQRQVAEAVGVSPAAVGQWETGTDTPKRANALALDAALSANGAIASALGYTSSVAGANDDLERQQLLQRIESLDEQVSTLTELIRGMIQTSGHN